MMVLLIFSIVANRKIKHATEVPDTFQNFIELIVEKLDGVVYSTMGKKAAPKFVNYIQHDFYFHSGEQHFRFVWFKTANCRLWYNICTRSDHVCPYSRNAV